MRHVVLHGGHYLAVIVACLAVAGPLAGSRRTWRAPRAAIVVWQALALSLGLSVVGLCLSVGLAPYRTGELPGLVRLVSAIAAGEPTPAGLTAAHLAAVATGVGIAAGFAAVVGWQFVTITRVRARHRARLSLVADPDPADPQLLLVPHPGPLAYCLPGRHRTVVVSAGAVGRLDPDQLAAVLAHEHAHTSERHDLVLLPFAALRRVLPRSRLVARASAAVALLVEMCADDRALRRHSPECLSAALRVVGGHGGARSAPDGALGAVDPQVHARLERLAGLERPTDRPGFRPLTTGALAVVAVVAATPVSLFLVPLAGASG